MHYLGYFVTSPKKNPKRYGYRVDKRQITAGDINS